MATGTLLAAVWSTPAPAAPPTAPPKGNGWELRPSPSFDYAPGVVCDFGIHADPIEDEVYYRTLTRWPDGSVRTEAATGPLVYRLTNVATGASTTGDASASGVSLHHQDGGLTGWSHGPLLLGVRAGLGNLPRGFYEIDGPAWRLDITAANYRTVSGAYRITKNFCVALSG